MGSRRYNPGMNILLNGESLQVPDTTTIASLLDDTGLAERRVAVEVNREIIPRSRHAVHRLNPDDRVEIVHAIGGG